VKNLLLKQKGTFLGLRIQDFKACDVKKNHVSQNLSNFLALQKDEKLQKRPEIFQVCFWLAFSSST
jgi:hypothetical protein